jgi:hypothetical protein
MKFRTALFLAFNGNVLVWIYTLHLYQFVHLVWLSPLVTYFIVLNWDARSRFNNGDNYDTAYKSCLTFTFIAWYVIGVGWSGMMSKFEGPGLPIALLFGALIIGLIAAGLAGLAGTMFFNQLYGRKYRPPNQAL